MPPDFSEASDGGQNCGLRRGAFVMHAAIPGIGRVADSQTGVVTAEAFDSPALPIAKTWELPAGECRLVRLPVQTRVYWCDPDTGQWSAGRVTAVADKGYAVRFPNSEYDRIVPGHQLRVRWEMPTSSPVEVLATGAAESPFFRDARIPMLRSLIAQRRACANFTAVLSSAIEIYPHQIDTALTVLSDPVQRYLLADEVGLGKTIEAGLVIRQLLIDNPRAKIAVLAPEVLRRQWRDELLTKFFIDDFPQATVKISSHDAPDKWSDYRGFDLVVVDEVHFLTRNGRPDAAPYPALAALCKSVDRLLLLSATPSTAKPELHLALLHLLDPFVYRWDDLPNFVARFREHRELANAVDTLDADFEVLLPITVEEIRQMLPDDPTFESLADRVLSFLDDEGALLDECQRPELASAIEAIRAHIGETYRLHRRTIRHRRNRVLEDTHEELIPFEVTGRRSPAVLACEAPGVVDPLLEWQQKVAKWIDDNVDANERERVLAAYGDVLAVLASRVDPLSGDFRHAALWRVGNDSRAAEEAGLSALEKEMLRGAEVLPFEAEVLTAESASSEDNALLAQLYELVRAHRRTVVFCGSGGLPAVLTAVLSANSPVPVYPHTSATSPEAIEANVLQWRKNGGVLIADVTAEDGVNLQQADAAVHVRLPWSPNKLEQRIGRIDRYAGVVGASKGPAEHFVVHIGNADESFPAAWADLLISAFGAWTASMSAIQDRLDELQTQLWAIGACSGPQRMRESRDDVRSALADERREVQTMDALDAVQDISLGEKIAAQLGRSETQWKYYERDLRRYIGPGSGGIRFTATEVDGVSEFGVDTKYPPLVSPLMLMRLGRLPRESLRGVFDRGAALRRPGTRLFRLGNPFISGLSNVINIDERGQASAMLRRASTQDPMPYFGFDLLVEADLTGAIERTKGRGAEELRRYADALMAPSLARVWLRSGDSEFVRDEALLRWLNRSYDNERDVNLGSRPELLAEVFGGFDRFAKQARMAEDTAVQTVRNEDWLRARAENAYADASRTLIVRRSQAEARHAAGRLVTDTESYLFDVDVTKTLVDALRHPAIRVMAASCVIGATWTS